jgi:hypothetical protein
MNSTISSPQTPDGYLYTACSNHNRRVKFAVNLLENAYMRCALTLDRGLCVVRVSMRNLHEERVRDRCFGLHILSTNWIAVQVRCNVWSVVAELPRGRLRHIKHTLDRHS